MEKFIKFITENKGKILIALAILFSFIFKDNLIDVIVNPGPTPDTIIVKQDSFIIEDGFDLTLDSTKLDTAK